MNNLHFPWLKKLHTPILLFLLFGLSFFPFLSSYPWAWEGFTLLFLFSLFWAFLIYAYLWSWRGLEMNITSFLSFLWFSLSTIFFFLGFLRGLKGPFHQEDLPGWFSYGYSLTLFFFISLLLFFFFWPRSRQLYSSLAQGLNPFLASFPQLAFFSVWLLETLAQTVPFFAFFFSLDLLIRSLIPLLQSFLLLLWSWGNFNLQYSLLLLPLSWFSMIYGIFFFSVNVFLGENLRGIEEILEVLRTEPLIKDEENNDCLAFALTPLGQSQDYGGKEVLLANLWYRANHALFLLSFFLSLHPWVIFFRALSWFLLSFSFFVPPSPPWEGEETFFFFPREEGLKLILAPLKESSYLITGAKKDFFWVSLEKAKDLAQEKGEKFDGRHMVKAFPLASEGKAELLYWKTHGKVAGSFYAGPIDSDSNPRDVYLVPFRLGKQSEEKFLKGMQEHRGGNILYELGEDKVLRQRNMEFYAKNNKLISPGKEEGSPSSGESSTLISKPNSPLYRWAVKNPSLSLTSSLTEGGDNLGKVPKETSSSLKGKYLFRSFTPSLIFL